jgi:Asp-tRNA(Asn)/Glu-tRNA(Gln) amidotransferase C subunit
MADCQELYNDATTQFEELRGLARCKLTQSDADEIVSNLSSIISDLESRVDAIDAKLQYLTADIVALRKKIDGI